MTALRRAATFTRYDQEQAKGHDQDVQAVRACLAGQGQGPNPMPEPAVQNALLEQEQEVKQNNVIKTVKRKDMPKPNPKARGNGKGYVDAIAALEPGGDGVFLPTGIHSATMAGYAAAARISGIRFSCRTVGGGVIVTRES